MLSIMKIPGYYSIPEAAGAIGLTKVGAGKVARREEWPIAFKIGPSNFYYTEDVREYRDHQQRTKLAKELGWRGRGLYREDDIDGECPTCWAENFNGIEDGRKLEGIVNPRFLANFLNTIHYGEDNIVIENTNLPITHVPVGDGDGFFRKV
jgi:hypothetical protein